VAEYIKGLPIIVLVILLVVLFPVWVNIFMVLWNSTIPGMTGWQDINFLQACVILIIGKILS
jgi:hypothetical protein